MIAPYFESLAKSNPNIKFIKVDVDELEDIAAEAGVQAMPTFQVRKHALFRKFIEKY